LDKNEDREVKNKAYISRPDLFILPKIAESYLI